jgi:hypothetical protein
MGAERGVPSRWELLAARVRLQWQRLRDLSTRRARARSKEHHPAFNGTTVQEVTVTGINTAPAAGMAAVSTTRSSSTATLWVRPGAWFSLPAQHGNQLYAQPDFIAWLHEQRQDFEAHIDRRFEEYRRQRDRELGL